MRTNTLVTILLQSCNNLALVLYLPTTFDVKNHKLSHLKSSCFTNLVKFKIVRKILRQSCNNPAGCRIVWNLEIGRYLILVPKIIRPYLISDFKKVDSIGFCNVVHIGISNIAKSVLFEKLILNVHCE